MKISRQDVLRVAELANLELTEAEITTYGGQLESILSYCDKLNELDTQNTEPMAQVLAVEARAQGNKETGAELREDLPVKARVIEEVLKGAPDPGPPYFRVPQIIER